MEEKQLAEKAVLTREDVSALREIRERHRPTYMRRCRECDLSVPEVGCPTFALVSPILDRLSSTPEQSSDPASDEETGSA